MANTKVTSAVIESGAILSTHIASGAITSGHLSGINTAAVAEGTNLYYTDTRARASISVTGGNLSYDNSTGVLQLTDAEIRDAISATSSGDGSLTYTAGTGVIAYTGPSASEVQAHLSAGTGVTYSGGQISIGQAVGTSDTVSFGNITTAGYLRGPANFTIDPAAYGDDTGTLIIAGNLQVDGTTTTINSTTLTVDDLNLTLASGAANAAAANGAGITVDGASATLLYAASGDKFVFNKGLDVTGNIGVTGTVDGVDIAARDAVLTSTTTTANASLPLAGGTLTGNLTVGGTFTAEAVGQHNFKSTSYAILNLQTDTDDNGSSDDGIFKITNGSAGTTKAELRWDESEDLVHVSYGDHGRHVSINSTGKVGIGTGSTSPTATLDVAGTALVENAKLKALAESNTDSAVDVFVYDTRKDSDGGAWRKRTQHTSWYNETLNTSTRGARKEFPSVAVIVATAPSVAETKIIIYDADDPTLPMWMVLSARGNNDAAGPTALGWYTSGTPLLTAVTALNGIVAVVGDGGLRQVKFVSDSFRLGYSTNSYITNVNIAQREIKNVINEGSGGTGGDILVWYATNDVAMTVLPNAPIDAGTGLPVPTIAVATDGGVSIVKDNGTVVDIVSSTAAGGGYDPEHVSFDKDNRLTLVQAYDSGAPYLNIFENIPSADIGQALSYSAATAYTYLDTGLNFTGGSANFADLAHAKDNVAIGTNTRLSLLDSIPGAPTKSMVAYITSDYNTGYMVGDTKVAALSDTDTTNVTGSSKLTNDLFNGFTGTAGRGFTVNGNGTVSVTNGNGSADGILTSPSFNLVVGKRYIVDIHTSGTTGTGIGFYLNGSGGPNGYLWNRQFEFVATQVSNSFFLYRYLGHNGSGTITKAVVREAEPDRSVNGNGLQVFGTVTKTAVATGADLVAYSGFSASNFIQQPINSAIQTTNPRAITCWVKSPQISSGYQYLWTITDHGSYHYGLAIFEGTSGNGGKLYSYDQEHGVSVSSYMVADGSWHCVCFTDDETNKKIYVDGKLVHTVAHGYDLNSANKQNMKLRIGTYESGIHPMISGSLALLRISGTMPSEEQIAKMYNDEKQLFQPNAKATLYGTSDAVTALAYDDDTELLHAGTSAGRSVFQGLNRVDNTTDAVGAAISASNGLVAED